MDYYLLNEVDGSHLGPYSLGQLRAMWERGQVNLLTSYWTEGMEAWMPLRTLEADLTSPAIPVSSPAIPPVSISNTPLLEDSKSEDSAHPQIVWDGKVVDMLGIPTYYQEEFRAIYTSKETYQGEWNWYGFWFGIIWAMTKGLWFSVVISLVAAVILGAATCGAGSLLVGIIYQFIYGYRGNYLYYYAHVKNKQLPI